MVEEEKGNISALFILEKIYGFFSFVFFISENERKILLTFAKLRKEKWSNRECETAPLTM